MQGTAVHPGVIVDAVWPRAGLARELGLLLAGSAFIALAAQVSVPLPFSPVPITGQTFALLLLGALYGSTRGAATALTYLVLGIVGLPVFAPGGALGIARLVGPTAGYLLGYPLAAFVVGWLSERGWDRKPVSASAAMVMGNALIYLTGALWLSRFVGWDAVLRTGILPFVPGDAIKIALATMLLPSAWKLIDRPRTRQ